MYQVESLLGNQAPDVRLSYVRLASPSVFVDRGRVSQRSRAVLEADILDLDQRQLLQGAWEDYESERLALALRLGEIENGFRTDVHKRRERSRIAFERNELTSHLEFWAKMVTLGPHRGVLVGVDEGS